MRFLEGGNGDPLLLIHGFNANVHSLRSLMMELQRDFRVIALEVPGLSYRRRPNRPDRFRQRFLLDIFQAFVKHLKLEKFHILGTSVGATYAASYAAEKPEQVQTLAMLAIPPLFKPDPGDPQRTGANPEFYVPLDLEGVDHLIDFMYYKPPMIPRHIKERYLKLNIENRDFLLNVLNEALKRTALLVPRLRALSVPSILIYGEHDQVTTQATVEYLESVLPNIQSYRVNSAGHTIYIENPVEVARAYISFVRYAKREHTSRHLI